MGVTVLDLQVWLAVEGVVIIAVNPALFLLYNTKLINHSVVRLAT